MRNWRICSRRLARSGSSRRSDLGHRAAIERADDQVHGLSRGALNLDEVEPAVAQRLDQPVVGGAFQQVDAFHRLPGRPEVLPGGDGAAGQAAGAQSRCQDKRRWSHASVPVCAEGDPFRCCSIFSLSAPAAEGKPLRRGLATGGPDSSAIGVPKAQEDACLRVAPIARLSGCRRHKRRRGVLTPLLRLRRPDSEAIGATRKAIGATREAIGATRARRTLTARETTGRMGFSPALSPPEARPMPATPELPELPDAPAVLARSAAAMCPRPSPGPWTS